MEPPPRPPGPAAGQRTRRQRRPSGEPPALPRESKTGRWWWALGAVLLLGVATELVVRGNDDLRGVGDAVLRWFEGIRTPWLTDIA
jgi:hypothetical protein